MIRKKIFLQCIASFVLLGLFIGCASQQKIMVESNPTQSIVYVDDTEAGITPCTIEVKKKGPSPVIRLEKRGYGPNEVKLKKHFNVWYPIKSVLFGVGYLVAHTLARSLVRTNNTVSVGFGYVIGATAMVGTSLIGGAFTGDYYKYKPKKVNLKLDEIENQPSTIVDNEKESEPPYGPAQENNLVKDSTSAVNKTAPTVEQPKKSPQRVIKLELGVETKIITKTGEEFSGTLIEKTPNMLVLDVKGSRLTFYKNGIKDIQQE